MKATGKIQIDEPTENIQSLDDPTMVIESVWIKCRFTGKNGQECVRMKELNVDMNNIESVNIEAARKEDALLKKFKP
jgi:hypothetical protein